MGLGGGKRDWKDTPAPAGPGGTLPKAGRTRAAPTQLSGTMGVTEDVASIALLGGSVAGTAEIPDTVQVPVTETPILEMLSDAEVMLRVATGDDVAFDYLDDEQLWNDLPVNVRRTPRGDASSWDTYIRAWV